MELMVRKLKENLVVLKQSVASLPPIDGVVIGFCACGLIGLVLTLFCVVLVVFISDSFVPLNYSRSVQVFEVDSDGAFYDVRATIVYDIFNSNSYQVILTHWDPILDAAPLADVDVQGKGSLVGVGDCFVNPMTLEAKQSGKLSIDLSVQIDIEWMNDGMSDEGEDITILFTVPHRIRVAPSLTIGFVDIKLVGELQQDEELNCFLPIEVDPPSYGSMTCCKDMASPCTAAPQRFDVARILNEAMAAKKLSLVIILFVAFIPYSCLCFVLAVIAFHKRRDTERNYKQLPTTAPTKTAQLATTGQGIAIGKGNSSHPQKPPKGKGKGRSKGVEMAKPTKPDPSLAENMKR